MAMASSAAIVILATMFAIAATVLAYIFIVPEKKAEGKKGIVKILHDLFNFKFLIVEKILQALYIFATAYAICGGFFMLFSFERYYYRTEWVGYWGFLVMILGPIAIRIAYEFVMMAILLVKNVIQINNKLKNQNGDETNDIFASDFKTIIGKEEQPAQPVNNFCPNCGSRTYEDGSCPNCK